MIHPLRADDAGTPYNPYNTVVHNLTGSGDDANGNTLDVDNKLVIHKKIKSFGRNKLGFKF